jgi:hypothetical protein
MVDNNFMEMVNRFKMTKDGSIKTWKIPRYVETGKKPDYTNPKARKIIKSELGSMRYEVLNSEKSSSVLVRDEQTYAGFSHRAYSQSTFPEWMRKSGIGSTKDFIQVLNQNKGVRYDRLKNVAIDRLNNGYKNNHGYALPDVGFKTASNQLYDRKDVIFRRVRGRLIPMRVPKHKRLDLMSEAPF